MADVYFKRVLENTDTLAGKQRVFVYKEVSDKELLSNMADKLRLMCQSIIVSGACTSCPFHGLCGSNAQDFIDEEVLNHLEEFEGFADDVEERANQLSIEDERFNREYDAWKDREVE